MDKILGASWKTTLIGFVVAFLTYFTTVGFKWPESGTEWKATLIAALVAAFGRVTQDSKNPA